MLNWFGRGRRRAAIIKDLAHGSTEYGEAEHGVPLAPLLAKFLKKDKRLADIPTDKLGLLLINRRPAYKPTITWVSDYLYSLCLMDAPIQFMLAYHGEGRTIGLANIGFDFDMVRRNILVKQLQAQRFGWLEGSSQFKDIKNSIANLRWEKLMVQAVLDWAAKYRFDKVKIREAKNNLWVGRETPERNQRIKMHYDVTAKRMGFKKPRWSRYWRKKVTAQ